MEIGFRRRIAEGQPQVGMFIKSAASETTELLGAAGLDFAIVDAEHAPFGMAQINRVVAGARLGRLPCLVRLPAPAAGLAGRMLDLGAAGVVVPHVADEEAARAAVAEARFAGGRRGYSPSTRANGYGLRDTKSWAARADAGASLWCQIEDAAALDRLDAIAAVDGVDALFIGRADLAHSLGVAAGDPRVAAATAAIAAAGRRHGRAVAIFVADMAEAPALHRLGITVFACGSDQSHLAAAARRLVAARDTVVPNFPAGGVKPGGAAEPNPRGNPDQEEVQ